MLFRANLNRSKGILTQSIFSRNVFVKPENRFLELEKIIDEHFFMTPSQKQLDRLYADKIIPKTMYDVLTEELNEKQHYRRSQLNWERFAYYFCIPMAFVGGLSAYYEMSHRIEHSKEHYRNYKPYHFLRNRVKPFMFGDGDTTLFCNKEFEYIPGYVPEWYQKELEAAERGEAPEKEHH